MIAILEIIGGFVRYLVINAFNKITGKKENITLSHILEDKKGRSFANAQKDYSNGIVGFVTFALLLFFAYLLFD
ncbi:hypothetical protein B4Q04_14575 [Zobellia sp. OII3]|uniref:hypothetical protein n=1 Tax=Zobellia sp. OII3 TaxID=2034520 RepID=UPI000B52E15B|nr:hypothetical protein [Zobellia sp. OII3]OWW24539.1 hypothetical protein B4Q04_14575 [Zobellia sp. OII3]